jgi:hypothetical protein
MHGLMNLRHYTMNLNFCQIACVAAMLLVFFAACAILRFATFRGTIEHDTGSLR